MYESVTEVAGYSLKEAIYDQHSAFIALINFFRVYLDCLRFFECLALRGKVVEG